MLTSGNRIGNKNLVKGDSPITFDRGILLGNSGTHQVTGIICLPVAY